jgi:cytochrome P450
MMKVDGREVTVPPNTTVYPNIIALQTTKEYWGKDCLTWKPSRWIESTSNSLTSPVTKELLESETSVTPVKGSYIPWADGPRICPGKKFAQVEFVAVIAVLLWKHRVSINPREGESLEQARKRVYQVIEDSETKFTLQMRRPETVDLVFVKK